MRSPKDVPACGAFIVILLFCVFFFNSQFLQKTISICDKRVPAMGVTRNPDFNPCLRERGFEAERDEVLDMMEIEDSE